MGKRRSISAATQWVRTKPDGDRTDSGGRRGVYAIRNTKDEAGREEARTPEAVSIDKGIYREVAVIPVNSALSHDDALLGADLVRSSVGVIESECIVGRPLVVVQDIIWLRSAALFAISTFKGEISDSNSPSSTADGCLNKVELTNANLYRAKSLSAKPNRSCNRFLVSWKGSF
jgi:hypothetical protein